MTEQAVAVDRPWAVRFRCASGSYTLTVYAPDPDAAVYKMDAFARTPYALEKYGQLVVTAVRRAVGGTGAPSQRVAADAGFAREPAAHSHPDTGRFYCRACRATFFDGVAYPGHRRQDGSLIADTA